MHVEFVSSLTHPGQFGGASLRCAVFDYIYEKLGFTVNTTYQDQIKNFKKLSTYTNSLKYGRAVADLFLGADLKFENYDILHLDRLRFFSYDIAPAGRPIIYNAHNLEFEIYFQRHEKEKAENFFKYEISRIKEAKHTFVCSDRERDILIERDPTLAEIVSVIPNLVHRKNYHFKPNKKIIAFVGTLNYNPNIQAVRYLCKQFFPSLKPSLFNDFEFVIAGGNPTPEVVELVKQSQVKLLTNLTNEEMRDLIAKTYISLVPLFAGSGSRLKIVESIFSRARVLSTELGSEGIESRAITTAPIENFLETFNQIILSKDDLNWDQILDDFAREHDLETWFEANKRDIAQILCGE